MTILLRIIGLALLLVLSAAKPPQLSPRDAKVKIEEILKAHVTHHALTPDLIARAFNNYLDELDICKTYLLKNEVLRWTDPSPELLEETLAQYKKENFSNFEALHETIVSAVERRNQIEKRIVYLPLPEKVQSSDFKDLSWPNSEEDLEERI